MIILKQVIHDSATNSVEATWVDENEVTIKCHSYADVQMDMLRNDLGGDAAAYADLIATVEAHIVPPVPPTQEEINAGILAQIETLERAVMTPRDTREMKIIWAEDKAVAAGAAASATFTLTQFNQTVTYYGLVLTAEQQDSVALGIVPAFTPQQSIDIAYATNVAYRLNVDLDNQIAALRAQLV